MKTLIDQILLPELYMSGVHMGANVHTILILRTPSSVVSCAGCSSIVKQEPASSSYHQTAPTCACGAHVVFCSAPGCCKAYCKPCDRELKKMKDTFSGFQTCSFFCTDRSKTAYCEEHRGLLSRCDACNELLCKKPRCNDCKQIICEHCLDEHELKVCSGRQQSRRAAVTVRC